MKKRLINLQAVISLWVTLFTVIIAAVPARVFAQSFPPPDSGKDFSDTMIETPNTAMALDPSDIPVVQAEASYPGAPATVQPETPDTLPTNYNGPIGVTGVIDNVTTGCSYSPLSHSALRGPITDIDVPGALGKYGLKMRRYYNSRSSQYWDASINLSPGWFHEYSWALWSAGYKLISAQGNVYDFWCTKPVGVSEGWDDGTQAQHANGGTWRLADGGRVHFSGGNADYIDDPYGLRTTITRDGNNRVLRVTEPGGRYLLFTYGTGSAYTDPAYGNRLLQKVAAYDGQGHLIEKVTYTYRNVDSGGIIPLNGQHVIRKMLTGVAYDDNTSASYTYRTDNVPDTPPSTFKFDPLLEKCNDKRYNGPMRDIAYEYHPLGPHGEIRKEYKPNGPLVSKIEPDLPLNPGGWLAQVFTETRGDGPTRTFTYTPFKIYTQNPQEPDPCLDVNSNAAEGRAPQQMLTDYTDFRGNATHIGYDTSTWYITSVRDANGNTTSYQRGDPPSQGGIGEIKKITHPGGAYIQYSYETEANALDGHYLHIITDENGKLTTITRDPTRHWITRIEYPSDGNTAPSYEEFLNYNSFGQARTHHMKNSAYESFVYDGRGLLTDKYDPKFGSIPGGNDPHTHYDYYTATDGKFGWIDRVKKATMPANWLDYVATETYQYDLTASLAPCPGPGLVTMVTHADNRYHSATYDQWGNKRFEWNELGERTDYLYDGYNRVKSVTRANETTTYDYAPTEGGQSYPHTSNSPYWVTLPTAVKTHNVYDENWRKTSASVTGRTTWFHYDLVGNMDCVTDPRGSGPCGASYTTTTQYDSRNRKWKVWDAQGHLTTFSYDDASNLTYITRPDGSIEHKGYDAMDRVIWDIMPYSPAGQNNSAVNLVTWFQYNPSGTVNKVTLGNDDQGDPNPNHWTTFDYDASDRRKTMTYQNGQTRVWSYDNAGNLYTRKAVNGEILYFAYDNRNRKYGESWMDANSEWRYFGLDAGSRLRRATNGIGVWWSNFISDVHRDYGLAGRLTVDRQDLDGVNQGLSIKDVNYEYDVSLRGGDGKPTHMYVPNVTGGYDYAFQYDGMGRFEKILRNGTTYPHFQYYYDNASNETQRRGYLSNTATVDQFYNPDSLDRIGEVELKRNNNSYNPQEFEAYGYYPNGQLYSVARGDNLQDQFGYYLDGELFWVMYGVSGAMGPDMGATVPADDPTKEKTPEDFLSLGMQPDYTQTYQRAVTYVYDKAGNRLGTNDNGVVVTVYTPNDINQYQSVSINNVADPISNGNQHEVTSYKNVNYTYMKDEHLVGVSSINPNHTYQMAYDALGRCVKRTVDGVKKYYIYDGERPILEYNATGGLVGYNLYGKGIDEILMRYDPTLTQEPRTFYYQQDHEGSVTRLVNGNGDIIEKYRYDVFGNPLILAPNNTGRSVSIVSNRFMFTGREFSNLFGFYEYRARAYNPLLGRFMSEDPKLFDAGNYNLFRYCHNDPIDMTDPMGLDAIPNGDGTYHFVLRSDIVVSNTIGGYVVNKSDGIARQCAGAAQFLTGTRMADGTLHDAPRAGNHGWSQGGPLTKETPDGTMVARGWKNGFYPNESPEQAEKNGSKILNHTGIKVGWDDRNQRPIILDQNASRDASLQKNSYDPKEGDWSVVNAKKPYDPDASRSDFKPAIQKDKAAEHTSNVLHSKPDPSAP
jgi:RHS repeat-associated protein